MEEKRKIWQIRFNNPGQVDRRMYAPNRDLAHIGPAKLALVFDAFDNNELQPDLTREMQAEEFSIEDIGRIAASMSKLMNLIADADIPDFATAVKQCGFNELPWPARRAFLAELGFYYLSACFVSRRDVTPLQGEMPADTKQFVDAAREFYRRVTNSEGVVDVEDHGEEGG